MRRHDPVRRSILAIVAATIAASQVPLATAQETKLASVPDGFDEYQAWACDVSGDGRLVAFQATSRSGWRVEVRDRLLGSTTVVTPFWNDAMSLEPAISHDGTTVAFYSGEGLVPEDTNFRGDIYVVSSNGTGLELASIPDGPPGSGTSDGLSSSPRVSGDGDRVVFQSYATNLVSGPIGPYINVYVRIRSTSTTRLLNTDAAGVPSNSPCYDPFISGNGRWVAFWGAADNLVPGDTNSNHDVFVKDLETGAITLVSQSGGVVGDGTSALPSLSYDGRYVTFNSNASNFGYAGGWNRIYRHDRDPDGNGIYDEGNGVTELVSRNQLGGSAQQHCLAPRISDDGQRVLYFGSCDTDQELQQNRSVFSGVSGTEVFLFDFATGQTTNVYVDSDGNHPDGGCYTPFATRYLALSGDGSTAVYTSYATDLDASYPDADTNPDVFAHDVAPRNVSGFLGYDKRGSNGFFPEFSVVGGLATGETAEFRVRRAPPSALSLLLVGFASNPTSALGGTLVPLPAALALFIPMDANGSFTASLAGGGGPVDLYLQWAFIDLGVAPRPFAISNALKVTIDP